MKANSIPREPIRRRFLHACRLALVMGAALTTRAALCDDPFAENVRKTPHQSPEEERKSFRLPPGFEIELVAAEPEIQKPLNIAFDSRGRLWVADTREYPYAAAPGAKARDTIKVLEDADGDGRAEKVTTFADGLNIPIGLYPWRRGVIAFSIPDISYFEDTDGDGRSDRRTVLYGPLGWERDTHGLQNGFTRGFDGWVYACHGFNNRTLVKGTGGGEVRMESGNTYRFRLDGSRIEQFTWGQVNPFGMCTDSRGDLYTADCHSAPIYMLLRGGHYPSFGKPDDGLGFVPAMMTHLHGSTAISGIVLHAAGDFPPEYRGNVFVGNVMTSRINRDSIHHEGSTASAREEPDFVTTTDPWFRPVDLKLGPDGALYVADFYNRIIGHYEVPLDHPGRDRTSGRIWRIVYRGGGAAPSPARRADLSAEPPSRLVEALGDENLTRRVFAMNELVDRSGKDAVAPAREGLLRAASPLVRAHALWVLHRLGALGAEDVAAAARDPDALVRVHAMRVLSEKEVWSDAEERLAAAGLADADPFARRAAADALGTHPSLDHVRPLLDALRGASAGDQFLRHTMSMALRNQLRPEGHITRTMEAAGAGGMREEDSRLLAKVLLAIPSAEAGVFLLRHVQAHAEDPETLTAYLRHISRFVPAAEADALARLVRERFRDAADFQLSLFASVSRGLEERGSAPEGEVRAWGADLARRFLDAAAEEAASWWRPSGAGRPGSRNPWVLQKRRSADGDSSSAFLTSLPLGEELTGTLRSRTFVIPPSLRFHAAGHRGFPDQPPHDKNILRLREAETGDVLAEASPPRNDTAQPVTWELAAYAGKRGYIEVTDGDNGPAYAWLAVGRFEPPVAPLPLVSPSDAAGRIEAAMDIVVRLHLEDFVPRLEALVRSAETEPQPRAAAARAILHFRKDDHLAAIAPILGVEELSGALRSLVAEAIVSRDASKAREAIAEVFRASPARAQAILADHLAGSEGGAATLIDLVARGLASRRLLLGPSIQRKLLAVRSGDLKGRLEELTEDLPPAKEEAEKVIDARLKGYPRAASSFADGERVFTKTCAPCHQIAGKGVVIGPQLDGIANRGIERIIEDLVDPNRNVDVAFRTSTLVLDDGAVITGLFRRLEGEVLVLADSTGKEVSVPRKRIMEEAKSDVSLMPDNLVDTIPEEDFHHLLRFLLEAGK